MKPTSFGSHLRRLREQIGMSIGELAKKANVSSSYISQMETGQRSVPSMEIIRKLADAIGVDHFLLGVKAGHINGDDWIEWGLNSLADPNSPGLIHQEHQSFISQLLKSLKVKEPERPYTRSISDAIMELNSETRFDALIEIYAHCINRFGKDPLVEFTLTARGEQIAFESLLNQKMPIQFNGRVLTLRDRKRILDMMALLFPDSD